MCYGNSNVLGISKYAFQKINKGLRHRKISIVCCNIYSTMQLMEPLFRDKNNPEASQMSFYNTMCRTCTNLNQNRYSKETHTYSQKFTMYILRKVSLEILTLTRHNGIKKSRLSLLTRQNIIEEIEILCISTTIKNIQNN